jgi:hypothetical protein
MGFTDRPQAYPVRFLVARNPHDFGATEQISLASLTIASSVTHLPAVSGTLKQSTWNMTHATGSRWLNIPHIDNRLTANEHSTERGSTMIYAHSQPRKAHTYRAPKGKDNSKTLDPYSKDDSRSGDQYPPPPKEPEGLLPCSQDPTTGPYP